MAKHRSAEAGTIPDSEWPPAIYIEADMEVYGFDGPEALRNSLSREGRHERHPRNPLGQKQ